jgi:hypothetical protein
MRRFGLRTAKKMRSHRDSEDCSLFRLAKPRTEQVPQLSRYEALCGRTEASKQAGSPVAPLRLLHIPTCFFRISESLMVGSFGANSNAFLNEAVASSCLPILSMVSAIL